MSLVEEAEKKVDKEKAEKLAQKIRKGKGFDLEDFRDQLMQMNSMGGVGAMMEKLPGMSNVPDAVKSKANDKEMDKLVAIINSMTPQERRYPAVINGSRKRRVAAGSGLQIQDVNRLLKQHKQMQKMMKKVSKGGLKNMMRGMGGMMPKGGMPF